MKLSMRNFALGTSFLVMGTLIVLDLNGIQLSGDQLLHVAMGWIIANMIFALVKILTHE